MSFRGEPYRDLEVKVDPAKLTVKVICDSCGKDNFPEHSMITDFALMEMWTEYCVHLQNSHKIAYPTPPPRRPRAVYMCVVCDAEPVDVDNGMDTCASCAAKV